VELLESSEDDDNDAPIFERLGKLEADERTLVTSKVTPASTRNSLADGSRFSRLEV
jgi:hypothetical protein